MHFHEPFHENGTALKKEKSTELLSYSPISDKNISQPNKKIKFIKPASAVYLEPLRGKQKRPKFLLDFKIHGLSNIPLFDEKSLGESSKKGVCYLKWQITNKKPEEDGTVNNHNIFNKSKTSKNNVVYMRDLEALKFFTSSSENKPSKNLNFDNMSREEIEESTLSMLPKNDHMHPSGTNPGMYKIIAQNENKASSKRKVIANNTCLFDYQPDAPTILKFSIDETITNNSSLRTRSKITRHLNPEYLVIECFSEILQLKEKVSANKGNYRKSTLGTVNADPFTLKQSETQISHGDTISVSSLDSSLISSEVQATNANSVPSTSNKHKVVSREKLGTVSINLTDYISEDEAWQTHNFLLKDSKINSVLKFSCHLKLIRGMYNDFDIPHELSSSQMPATLPKLYENKNQISQKFKERQDVSKQRRNSTVSSQSSKLVGELTEDLSKISTNYETTDTVKQDVAIDSTANVSQKQKEKEKQLQSAKILNSPLLSTMKYKNYATNYLRNPYEYVDPKDCIKDILDGKSGWNIDAILTQPLKQAVQIIDHDKKQRIDEDFLELEKMLDKYGSNRSADSTLKDKRNKSLVDSYKTKYKTTGGWLFSSIVQKKLSDNSEVEEYPIKEIWEGYDDKLV